MLPAAFPNLLANGSQGIAVGMATSIPPHNAAELCDAALYLIEQPDGDVDAARAASCQGPDFPTGGIIVDERDVDRRGLPHRPRLVPRARALGEGGHGPRHLARRRHRDPLRVQKSRLIEKIAELLQREEAAAARRRARRIGRGRPRRAGAARAHASIRSC